MKVETTRFGEVEIEESSIFTFIAPIIGFEDAKTFFLIENGDNNIFRWLQSCEFANLAFPVTLPANFSIEYTFEIDDATADKLSLTTAENLITFNIVSIPQGHPEKSTINLLAPILINKATNEGLQYIIPNSTQPTKHYIFPQDVEVV